MPPFIHGVEGAKTEMVAAACLVDATGRCISANDALGELLGSPRDRLLKKSLGEILVEIDPTDAARLLARASARGYASECLHVYIAGRGHRRLEIAATRLLSSVGGELQLIWRDVTGEAVRNKASQAQDGRGFASLIIETDLTTDRGRNALLALLAPRYSARAALFGLVDDDERTFVVTHRFGIAAELPRIDLPSSFLSHVAATDGAVYLPALAQRTPNCGLRRATGCGTALVAALRGPLATSAGYLCVLDPMPSALAQRACDEFALAARSYERAVALRRVDRSAIEEMIMDEDRRQTVAASHRINNHLTCVLGAAHQLRTPAKDEGEISSCLHALEEAANAAATDAALIQRIGRKWGERRELVRLNDLVEEARQRFCATEAASRIEVESGPPHVAILCSRRLVVQALIESLRLLHESTPHDPVRVAVTWDPEHDHAAVEIVSSRRRAASGPSGASQPNRRSILAFIESVVSSHGASFDPDAGTDVSAGHRFAFDTST